MSGAVGRTTVQEFIPALVLGLSQTVRGGASGSGDMAKLLGSTVCAGVVFIHTPPMGGTKGTAMPVVAHGGLKFLNALLGLFLGGQGCRSSGSSDRVRAVDGGGLQRGEQGFDI